MKFLALLLLPMAVSAAPLNIDLTTPVPAPTAAPYGPGTAKDPQGNAITLDSRSFFLDGKPWVPISGEIHYSRYPREEWRDELLKMKAGGINVVSTYVFWIHQEEVEGKFDWTGQRSLRDFLQLCKDLGLKAFVRMGPWCHGEVRNGGFPDWVQNSGTKLRTTDPAFLKLVEPLYQQEAEQMRGLLWKDGGPVIGVQLDNECANAAYLLALKKMAQADGVDVPYYAITGWQGGLPKSGLLPLFGGYTDGFWSRDAKKFRNQFLFTSVRDPSDLGAEMVDKKPGEIAIINQFPYACVEIGAGMMSDYTKRIKVNPEAVAAMALTKLGSGNNLPGYYMYQGGINPDGLTTMQEDHPNPMPLKDYDFQTALGACGQVRDQFHLLFEQHLFLSQFGPALARMPVYFPDQRPASLDDFATLRWAVRSDGASGFVFFNNKQTGPALPAHTGVQFHLKTAAGEIVVPREPVTISSGVYGFWPFNMDCDGVTLRSATVQPLCRLKGDDGLPFYFFVSQRGVIPDLVFPANAYLYTGVKGAEETGGEVRGLRAGVNISVRVVKTDRSSVVFVVLTPDQARRIALAPLGGKDRLFISNSTILADGAGVRLQAPNIDDFTFSVFPPPPSLRLGNVGVKGSPEWVFKRFVPVGLMQPATVPVGVTQVKEAGADAVYPHGYDEATWKDAAVYKLDIPADAANRRITLNIHYIGDAARLYIGDQLYDDNFYNGDSFAIGLWRIPPSQWPNLRLKIIPYSDALAPILPVEAARQVTDAKAASLLNRVTVTTSEQLELPVTQP
ncbi:MAG TPA: beta-galactosidase [Chthoniobacteraceae bacterium]|jgi:hypothetical protein|nr:beta-galactosidase [Chthoniobacteraceae bacterium]